MRNEPYEGADVIDSRQVIERIEELTDDRDRIKDAAAEKWDEAKEHHDANADGSHATADENVECADCLIARWDRETFISDTLKEEFSEDDAEELAKLEALQAEADGCADWRHGETLISDDYFERYAQELAEDIGAVNSNAGWPNSFIDWPAAAEALKQDYTSVEYGSTTYWIRS
jgi:hypothetical protein